MKKHFFHFWIVLIAVLITDLAIGIGMVKMVGDSEPSWWVHIMDEIISFPISQWNKLFPERGFYRATSDAFWMIILFNAFMQSLFVFALIKLVGKRR